MDINKFSPTGNIDKKHLVSLANYTEEEIYEILYRAKEIAMRLTAGEKLNYLKNKFVSLLTKRSFARSRIAFETAVTKLSGIPMISTMHGSELETIIKDKLTMEAISGYGINAIVVQTAETTDAEQIENAGADTHHRHSDNIIHRHSHTVTAAAILPLHMVQYVCKQRHEHIGARQSTNILNKLTDEHENHVGGE